MPQPGVSGWREEGRLGVIGRAVLKRSGQERAGVSAWVETKGRAGAREVGATRAG